MPLFEVVLKQTYGGQECINRWNYLGAGSPSGTSLSLGLLSAMGFIAHGTPPVFLTDTLFDKLRGIQHESVKYREVICLNVYDPTDFYTTAFPDPTLGHDSLGHAISPVIAAGFRTNLVRRDIARGTKRFVGVADTWQGVGGSLNPDYINKMEELGEKMTDVLTFDDDGSTLTYNPVICQKEKYTTPSGKTAYRYYSSLTVQLSHVAQGFAWEVYDTTRSQTSRQVGKGS